MDYTVKALADLAGVTVRTLHYYDEIGLLPPSRVGENGYRYYDANDLFRLQQILFFRELDLSLEEIGAILDRPDFDLLATLQSHRDGLEARIRRLRTLIHTVDTTILTLTGEVTMSEAKLFTGFSEEEEKVYAEQAREQWGEEVDDSYRRWNAYTPEQKETIKEEGQAIYRELAELVGDDPAAPAVQQRIGRWHQHLRYFYEPSVGRLRGLAQGYTDHPEFAANFAEIHPQLAPFIRAAIEHYCDTLEGGE